MVQELRMSKSLRRSVGVLCEAIGGVLERARLPRIIGRRRRDDDSGAEAGEVFRGVNQVGWVG